MVTESRRGHSDGGKRARFADRALVALIRAAEAGAAAAAEELAQRFLAGNDVERDEGQALHWFSVGARLGDADAQNNFGTMLLNGIGCEADAVAAVPWYRASAEQGNAVAQFNLGLRYLHGDGVDLDDHAAGDWIAQSAAQGYVPAIGQLGTIYRFGRGTEPDLLQAAQLHLAAAQAGDVTSHGNLSDYWSELTAIALAGSREAAFDLCRMYGQGLGVEADPALCWGWIRWAHRDCDPMPEGAARSDSLDSDVERAFGLFRDTLDGSVRRRGEARIRALRSRNSKSSVVGLD